MRKLNNKLNYRIQTFLLMGTLCFFSTAQAITPEQAAAPFLHAPIEFKQLTKNVYVISGPGGNIEAIAGDHGTILVDDGVSQRSTDIAQTLADHNLPAVTLVINTHWHFDHTGGNDYFAQHGAKIIAQENTKLRLSTKQHNDFLNADFAASPAQALPTRTFNKHYQVVQDGNTLQLNHVVPAHTDGDTTVALPAQNIFHTGDIFSNHLYPFIDYSSNGWIGGMVAAVDQVLHHVDDKTVIIPGHGPVGNKADLLGYRTMLATVESRVTQLMDQGKSEDEVVAAKPTQDFDAEYGHGFFTGDQFTRVVYQGLKAHFNK